MLDYRIKTFLTLYDEMNYRKTAEKLLMTQPGVTQHIHYIENYYGVKLFNYNGKFLTRTKDAEILKKHINSIQSEEQEIFKTFKKPQKNIINIGATKTIGEFVLSPIISDFLKDENNAINLIVDNTENLLKLIDNSKLDFAIIEGIIDKSKYEYELYKKEKFIGICSKEHKFAGKTINFDQLFSETLVLRELGSGTRKLFEQAILNNGYSINNFKRVLSISNFSVITDIVSNDKAITFAYEPIAKINSDLATFTVIDMKIKGEFNFVYTNKDVAKYKIDMLFHKN